MSVKNREKRQRTEKERKAAKAAKAKPKVRSPKEIAVLRKVSKAELDAVIHGIAVQFEERDKKIQETVQQLWENQREMKGGLDVAEFHLRAYRRLLADLCDKVYVMGDVELVDAPVGTDEAGQPIIKKVVNMRHYLTLARMEILQIHEEEQKRQEAAREAVRIAAEEAAKEKPEGEEAQAPSVPAQDDSIPDGAAVFGGDVHAEGNPGDQGQEEVAGASAGSGGEGGASSGLPEDAVSQV